MNKATLREAILRQLQAELALQTNAAALARDEAISEESRAQNKWDTHSQEAAYLAEGQARLAGEIRASLELYASLSLPALAPTDPVVLGALVQVEVGSRQAWYFLGPRAGGLELSVEGRDILVLTPSSPVGRQLIGKHTGDVIPATGRSTAPQRIISVA